jgi:hypothetical protein
MPNPRAGGPPLVGCPRPLIQYIRSYPPYLETISSIRNLRTRITDISLYSQLPSISGGHLLHPQPEDAHYWYLIIFAATLHIWRPSPPSVTWGRALLIYHVFSFKCEFSLLHYLHLPYMFRFSGHLLGQIHNISVIHCDGSRCKTLKFIALVYKCSEWYC